MLTTYPFTKPMPHGTRPLPRLQPGTPVAVVSSRGVLLGYQRITQAGIWWLSIYDGRNFKIGTGLQVGSSTGDYIRVLTPAEHRAWATARGP